MAEINRASAPSPRMYTGDQMSVRMLITMRIAGSLIVGRSISDAMLRCPSDASIAFTSRSSAACFCASSSGSATSNKPRPSRALASASA